MTTPECEVSYADALMGPQASTAHKLCADARIVTRHIAQSSIEKRSGLLEAARKFGGS
jgi:hypothetical protein